MKKVLFLILALLLTLTFVYAQEVTFYGYSEIGVHSEFLKDSNGNYSNTLGPVNLDYWNTYFKIKAEPSSLLESYFELHLYPNYSNLFGPGIIEVQKAHLIAKSSVMNLRVYYKEDATPFDDPLLLNKPGDLPGSSWIWGNGIEISGKAFDTNFLAGINSSDQISYVRLKRAFPPLMVGFTAMGSNWGQANTGKSLFGVDVTGKVANVDIKAEGIYGKCVWGPNPTDSEGGMVLYGDFSTQLTPVIKLYGIGKKVDKGYINQFDWFKTDQTQLIPGTSKSYGTYFKLGSVIAPISNLSFEPIVELINREDISQKTTNLTGIVTYIVSKNLTIKGTVNNSTVDSTNSTNVTLEATFVPLKDLSVYGKLYQPIGGNTELYGNLSTIYNNLSIYLAGNYTTNKSYLFLNAAYDLAKNLKLRGISQLFNDNGTKHNTYYLALELPNASLYFGNAPEEGTPADFVKQIGAKISFDF
ncbi:MAG: hypothetical protein ACPLVD_03945 [Dictyoglomus turgidum]|uniref:hypothetical protein n=1 Tax=Dictyoglomus turgidum TaxID=513050 RepID=UPI003C73D1C5